MTARSTVIRAATVFMTARPAVFDGSGSVPDRPFVAFYRRSGKRNEGDFLSLCAGVSSRFAMDVLAVVPSRPGSAPWRKNVFGKARAVCFLRDGKAVIQWGARQQNAFAQAFSGLGGVCFVPDGQSAYLLRNA